MIKEYHFSKNLTHKDPRLKRPTKNPTTYHPVICENTGQEFPSITAAAEWFSITVGAVSNSARDVMYNTNYKGLAFDYKAIF